MPNADSLLVTQRLARVAVGVHINHSGVLLGTNPQSEGNTRHQDVTVCRWSPAGPSWVPEGDDGLDVPDGLDGVCADLVVPAGRTRHDALGRLPEGGPGPSGGLAGSRGWSLRGGSPCLAELRMLSILAWLTIPASRSSWSRGLRSCPSSFRRGYACWSVSALRSLLTSVWSRFQAMVALCCTSGRNSQ